MCGTYEKGGREIFYEKGQAKVIKKQKRTFRVESFFVGEWYYYILIFLSESDVIIY